MANFPLSEVEGSGGGGSVIGDIRTLQVDDTDGLVDLNGEIYLRSGVVSTDLTEYPDAKGVRGGAGVHTGFTFSTSPESVSPQDIAWDGTHFYILEDTGEKVIQFTAQGVPTGFEFNTSAEVATPRGLLYKDNNFYVVGVASDSVFEYTATGVYTGFSFSVAERTRSPSGITWDVFNFYILGGNQTFKFTKEGVYTGESFSNSSEDTSSQGIVFNGSNLFIVTGTKDQVSEYMGDFEAVGLFNAKLETDTNLPIYLRIK